ncbi:hypothetical protein EC968_001448 [Mortierella alpina]|nr:hypothetical protein EC968_001448 [Mortierella alpina]
MASNQAPPWPAHGQSSSSTASSQPQPHPPHPDTAYSGAEHAYAHPHPSAFYGHPPHPGHHHQHPYFPYPPYGSMPYPPPYAHAPPHAYMGGHGPAPQPGHHNAHDRNESNSLQSDSATHAGAETSSVAAAAAAAAGKPSAKTQKAKAAPKAKATKGSTSSASDAAKSPATASTAPKTPKVFRFEGSISSESFKTTKSFDLAGVNILNRKPLDTKTALDKLQRRRETHNRVERKRRDCINQLIDDLTKLLPPKHLEEATSKCHRVNVLRGAVSHIKFLNESNQALALSIRSITGEDPPALSESTAATDRKASTDAGMSMDVDEESSIKEDPDRASSRPSSSSTSRSPSPVASTSSSSARKMAPPPVIITDAPSPSTERDPNHGASGAPDSFSLESRPRSNSFASSIGDLASPRSAYPNSPNFPPSPISPGPQHNGLFPPGETPLEGDSGSGKTQRQLSPFLGESPSPSPSLPPISSLAKLQLQSPSGQMSQAAASEDGSLSAIGHAPGRIHRGASSLPPLTIPEPHHLHPSYHQGAAAAAAGGGGGAQSSGSASNRSSLTLSPHSADQPPISPFMLSPLQPRSPSMGPLSSASPGGSPHPHWNFNGVPSPQMYPPHGSPFAHPYHYPPSYGYPYPPYPGQQIDPGHSPSAPPQQQQQHQQPQQPQPPQQSQPEQKQQKPSQASHARHKSLQPEPIFIQEEPWNVQRKRSTSSASGRAKSGSTASKKRAADGSKATFAESGAAMDPVSPTASLSSVTSFPTSPNPKKRTQLASYDEGEDDDDENSKRSKQVERGPEQVNSSSSSNGSRSLDSHRDSGVMVVVMDDSGAEKRTQSSGVVDTTAQEADEDAAQALTSLARTIA